MTPQLYNARHWLAWPPGALLFLALVFGFANSVLPPKADVLLKPVELLLAELPAPDLAAPAPPPAAMQPPAPTRAARPQPEPAPEAPRQVSQSPAPLIESPRTNTPAEPVPTAPAPATPVQQTATAEAPARPQPPPAASAPPAVPAAPSSAGIEGDYVAKVRSYLNASKRYPTGREASMQRPRGKTRVWFVLARNGSLQDAGVELSSGSLLLDNAALATVRRGTLPPFPDEAWAGAAARRFTADMDFVPAE